MVRDMSKPVLVIGNLVADVIVRPVDDVPRHDSLHIDHVEFQPGGCAGNVAVGLARLDVPVRLIGRVGADPFGAALLTAWGERRIDLSGVQSVAGERTSVSIVLIDSDGERRFLHAIGANRTLTIEALPEASLSDLSWLHIGGYFASPGLEDGRLPPLMARARALGITVSVDLTGESARRKRDLLPPLLPHTDLLLLNHDEGRKVTGLDEPEAIAATLRAGGAATVILKLGQAGCYFQNEAGSGQVPAYPLPCVDTTGAGDAFAAALIATLRQGEPLSEALRWANAAGGCCVTAVGATAGWEGWDDLRPLTTGSFPMPDDAAA